MYSFFIYPMISPGFSALLQLQLGTAKLREAQAAGAMLWLALGLAAFAAYWAPKVRGKGPRGADGDLVGKTIGKP